MYVRGLRTLCICSVCVTCSVCSKCVLACPSLLLSPRRAACVQDRLHLLDGSLSLQELQAFAAALRSPHVYIVVDACDPRGAAAATAAASAASADKHFRGGMVAAPAAAAAATAASLRAAAGAADGGADGGNALARAWERRWHEAACAAAGATHAPAPVLVMACSRGQRAEERADLHRIDSGGGAAPAWRGLFTGALVTQLEAAARNAAAASCALAAAPAPPLPLARVAAGAKQPQLKQPLCGTSALQLFQQVLSPDASHARWRAVVAAVRAASADCQVPHVARVQPLELAVAP